MKIKTKNTSTVLTSVQKTVDHIYSDMKEHRTILTRLEEQVKKTNGRVTELEKSEIFNRIIRYVLALGAIGLFSSVGLKILSLIDFTS